MALLVIDRDRVKAILASRVVELAEALGLPIARTSSPHVLRIGERKGSMVVHLDGPRKGFWHDFNGGDGGDMLALIMRVRRCGFAEALKWAHDFVGGDVVQLPSVRRLLSYRMSFASGVRTDPPEILNIPS